MLKRILLLSFSLWLIVAGGLAAHAAPCHMQAEEVAPAAAAHAHCDMMAPAPAEAANETAPSAPAADGICCCPAVLAALPARALPDTGNPAFRLPASFPLDASAPSRTLIPEPPPPKA